jgi:hypothetical protein
LKAELSLAHLGKDSPAALAGIRPEMEKNLRAVELGSYMDSLKHKLAGGKEDDGLDTQQ